MIRSIKYLFFRIPILQYMTPRSIDTEAFSRGEAGNVPGTESYVTPPPGYRLPAETRLGRVRLQVADLDRSLSYYQNILGFSVIERTSGQARLGAHGSDTVLVELLERPGARPVPRGGRLGLYHFAVLLPSRADLARFALHLADVGARAGASDHAVSEAFYLYDPDGLGIEVYADRPRSSWPVHDGRLGMTTVEIDLQSLLRETGGVSWNGMPAGTTIGHMHLHVGDLRDAERFYHDSLGFDKIIRMPGALFMSAGGYHHHLGTNTWAASADRPTDDEARLLEWTILLPRAEDVEAVARSIRESGYEAGPADDGWRLTDPWGTSARIAVDEVPAGVDSR